MLLVYIIIGLVPVSAIACLCVHVHIVKHNGVYQLCETKRYVVDKLKSMQEYYVMENRIKFP